MPERKKMGDYSESDMQVLFRRGRWESWDQAIDWLKTYGEADNELTPGEVEHMVLDLMRLKDLKVPFTSDPHQAFELARQTRSQARMQEVAVTLGDFFIEPKRIQLQANKPTRLVITNASPKNAHEFAVKELGLEQDIGPSQTAILEQNFKRTGTFEIACYEEGHEQQGMKGELIIFKA